MKKIKISDKAYDLVIKLVNASLSEVKSHSTEEKELLSLLEELKNFK